MYYASIELIRSKEQPIPHHMLEPHFFDERFTSGTGGKTIFLAPGLVTVDKFGFERVEGAYYNYDDRLMQWHGEKLEDAQATAAREVGNRDTAKFFEVMLQKVFEDPTTDLQHIVAGVNHGNGHPYHVYGTTSQQSN